MWVFSVLAMKKNVFFTTPNARGSGLGWQIWQGYSGEGQGNSGRRRGHSGGIRGNSDLREGIQRFGYEEECVFYHSECKGKWVRVP